MSMILVALMWSPILCNGKIVKCTSPDKLNAKPGTDPPQPPNGTHTPPTAKKEKETYVNPIPKPIT